LETEAKIDDNPIAAGVDLLIYIFFKPVAFGDRFQNGVEPKKFGVSAVADPDDARGG
jgi:hypothetical protein